MGRDLGRSPPQRAMAPPLARPSHPRRAVASGIALRKLWRDRMRYLSDWGLARRLHQLQSAHLRQSAVSKEGDDWAVAARAAARRPAGTAHRPLPRDDAFL